MLSLSDLGLSHNTLTGTIPEELYSLSLLSSLDLKDTWIEGPISTKIGQFTNLIALFLRNTKLSGTIPTELGLLKSLQLAWLHLTELSGLMPLEVCMNTGVGLLHFLQTDCNPESAPSVDCICCTACCDRVTKICLDLD